MIEDLKTLTVIVGGAAIIPLISRRLKTPAAAMEIIYGIIIFGILNTKQPDWFLLTKKLGFIFLMFIAGMELDLSSLLKSRRFGWYLFIPLFSLVITPLIFYLLGLPFFLGIVVSALSAGIIIPVLKESGLSESLFGKDAVGIALIGELIYIGILTLTEVYIHNGLTIKGLANVLKLVALVLLVTILLKVIYFLAWRFPKWVEMVMESDDPVEEGIRIVVFAAFGSALLALMSGVEAILGSFMAGLIFGQVFKSKGLFEDKINSLGFGFLIPFFFIGLGADFDIRLLSSSQYIKWAFFFVFMIYISNAIPLLFYKFMGLKRTDAVFLAIILSAPLSMLVVSSEIGEKMGLLSASQKSSIILAALISSILFPLLFKFSAPNLLLSPQSEKDS